LSEKKQANEVTKTRSAEYCALNVKVEDERLLSLRSMLLVSVFFFSSWSLCSLVPSLPDVLRET